MPVTDIEAVIEAAKVHGEESDPDHEVGDLQEALRLAWKLFSPEQRAAYLGDGDLIDRVDLGGFDIRGHEPAAAPSDFFLALSHPGEGELNVDDDLSVGHQLLLQAIARLSGDAGSPVACTAAIVARDELYKHRPDLDWLGGRKASDQG